MVAQGYSVDVKVWQDNMSTILFVRTGKSTSLRTKHNAVNYIFIKRRLIKRRSKWSPRIHYRDISRYECFTPVCFYTSWHLAFQCPDDSSYSVLVREGYCFDCGVGDMQCTVIVYIDDLLVVFTDEATVAGVIEALTDKCHDVQGHP